jgi:hypothetical protein
MQKHCEFIFNNDMVEIQTWVPQILAPPCSVLSPSKICIVKIKNLFTMSPLVKIMFVKF